MLSALQHCCTGAPIDCRNVRGPAPLIVATLAGHTAAVIKLLELNANVHAASKRGATALACAASLAHEAIARELIAHGAAVDAIDREWSTPLHRALAKRHTGIVRILVAAGANLELADKHGRTALLAELMYGMIDNKLASLDTSKLLLAAGARPDAGTRMSCLHLAVSHKHTQAAKVLLDAGAPECNITPLMSAATAGATDIMRLLLERGADITHTADGMTVLHACADQQYTTAETVQLLLDAGVDAAARNSNGYTVLDMLCLFSNVEAVKRHMLVCPDVTGVDTDGNSALMLACKPGRQQWVPVTAAATPAMRLEIVQVLLEHGQFDLEQNVKKDATALMLAVANGYTDIVQLLLSKGADVHTVDFQGTQPLGIAAHTGLTDIVKLLLQHGASVQHKNEQGLTALYCGLQMQTKVNAEIVELLLQAGSDVNAVVSSSVFVRLYTCLSSIVQCELVSVVAAH
eukprot:18018-Heterococcus_DN1.PRE.2